MKATYISVFLLFTTLSINLYASNLSECKGSPLEVDSKNDTSKELRKSWTNCSATVTRTDGNKYVGEFKDGKLNGQGTYTYPNGDKYVGEWNDNKRHGQGIYTVANGNKYVGEWKDNKYHGQGTFTHTDGNKYVGEWKDNKYHGRGTYTFSNGNKYVGEWKDSKYHGQGTFTHTDGDKYVGEWNDDKMHGQGTYTWADGRKYIGEWNDDKMHGQGTFTSVNGDKYVGEYKDHKWHGQGTYTFANGNKYVGEYKDDKRHGQGTYTWADGNKYVGEWKDSKYHGQGTFTSVNGDKYVGEFKDNKEHGQGTDTYANGDIYEGEFLNGKRFGYGVYYEKELSKVTAVKTVNGSTHTIKNNTVSHRWSYMPVITIYHVNTNDVFLRCINKLGEKLNTSEKGSPVIMILLHSYKINKEGYLLSFNLDDYNLGCGDSCTQEYLITIAHNDLQRKIKKYNLNPSRARLSSGLPKKRSPLSLPLYKSYTKMSDPNDPIRLILKDIYLMSNMEYYLDRKNLQLHRNIKQKYQCTIEPSLDFWMFAGKVTNKFIEQEQKLQQKMREDASKNKI